MPGIFKKKTQKKILQEKYHKLMGAAHRLSKSNGISFVPTLLGRESEQGKHEYLYWEFTEQGGKQALLKDNWKLVYFIKNEQYELYDLRKDKEEKINLINDNPLIFEELKGKMTHARTPSQEFPL